jgi:hypothetical protein
MQGEKTKNTKVTGKDGEFGITNGYAIRWQHYQPTYNLTCNMFQKNRDYRKLPNCCEIFVCSRDKFTYAFKTTQRPSGSDD